MDSRDKAAGEKQKVAMSSVLAALVLAATKIVVGTATGSLGILSEAAHSGLDLVAAVVTAVAVRISGRPADGDHQFGHGKVESFSALIEAALLLATCVWVMTEAVKRIAGHAHVVEANAWSFGVIVLSIAIGVNRAVMLKRAARRFRSQALEADALHFMSDVYSSAVVFVGLILVRLGVPLGDPLAALGVAGLVVVATVRMGKQTIDTLLDRAPSGSAEAITALVNGLPGVRCCAQARVRQSGTNAFVDVRVELYHDLHMEEVEAIMAEVEATVQAVLPDADVTVRPISVEHPQDLEAEAHARHRSLGDA